MQNASIIVSKYNNTPVVCGFINNKMEFLSFVRESALGKIYIGKVDHIVGNLDAAFVKIGKDEIGYLSLKNVVKSCITRKNSGNDAVLKAGDEVLVQIESEAIKTKKCKLTTGISLSGKYIVITLGRNGVGASVKLNDAIRKELLDGTKDKLQSLSLSYKDRLYREDIGFIIRTNAADLLSDNNSDYVEDIINDASSVLEKMSDLLQAARTRTIYSCLYSPLSNEYSEDDIQNITIRKALSFLKVRGYDDPQIIEDSGIHGIPSKIEELRSNKIWLKSGAFLIIEQLESFNAIDVNSGKAIKSKKDISYQVNLEASEEIMRQIRLRNLTGMILIDFINMKEASKYDELSEHVKELCRMDPIHTTFVDITGLGIMELTRNKNDKSLKELLLEIAGS